MGINYNKSFNFRNGVQVDDDNFVVNPNGLVGIGTSIPREFLDVYGTAKITGLVTTTNLAVTGISTFYNDVKIGSGITLSPSTGAVSATAFYGNGSTLSNIVGYSTEAWIINSARTGLSTSLNVGIGTTNPQGNLQIGVGVTINSSGNASYTGIITANSFSGSLNSVNLTGTINNSRLPSSINVGDITATTFYGSLIGTATTASSITPTTDIIVNSINSGFSTSGITTIFTELDIGIGGTAFTALNSGRIGVGTALPTSEFQIRKSSATLLEVLSDTSQARISIGQSVGVGKSTAVLRFGNTSKTFDITNNDTGNINTILHGGPSGVGTGRFAWLYGQDNSEKMSLTYGGNLGLGITNPSNTLHVVGTSTITSSSYVGDTLYVKNDIYLNTLRATSVASNIYVTSGISTFSTLYLYGGSNVLGIGTNNAGSYKFKIEDNLDAYLGTKAKLGTQSGAETTYFAGNLSADASLLKVFGGLYARDLYVDTFSPSNITVPGTVTATNGFSSGIGTAVKITTVGNRVYFTVAGVGVTSLQLF
jgi:hypothetical protein